VKLSCKVKRFQKVHIGAMVLYDNVWSILSEINIMAAI